MLFIPRYFVAIELRPLATNCTSRKIMHFSPLMYNILVPGAPSDARYLFALCQLKSIHPLNLHLLGSSNPHPSHWPLSFPLDPPPVIIHPANPIHVLWTLTSAPTLIIHRTPRIREGIKICRPPPIRKYIYQEKKVSLLSDMDSTHTFFIFNSKSK